VSGWRDFAYRGLAASNDWRAARRGRVGKRIVRRVVGRATGLAMRRMFR
jgi:hypothetical protein